ncbi:MAG: TerB family tellurite resistance protein [Nannocystaceae bacterium]|nr:TerB family tellurite resistance protein [Myxococcales bacterium]
MPKLNLNEQIVRDRYGQLPKSDEFAGSYFKALKVVAAADRSFPESERRALIRIMTRLGVSQEVQDDVLAFDTDNVQLESIFPGMTPGGVRARALLMDTIEIVRADGTYAAEERAAVARVAQIVAIDEQTRLTIESLVALEQALDQLRRSVLPTKDE